MCFQPDQTPVWHVDAARGPSTPSFDDLVSAQQYRRGHREAEGPSSFQVDNHLELGWQLEGQVGWFGTFENLAHEGCGTPIQVISVGAIRHQTSDIDEFAVLVDGWKAMRDDALGNKTTLGIRNPRRPADDRSLRACSQDSLQRGIELAGCPQIDIADCNTKSSRCLRITGAEQFQTQRRVDHGEPR